MSFVAFEQRGPIGVLTMNRPEALNALNEQVLRDLDAARDGGAANDEILVDCGAKRLRPGRRL